MDNTHIYCNTSVMMYDLRSLIGMRGKLVAGTREVIGVFFTLTKWKDRNKVVPNLPFCKAELKERLDPKYWCNPGRAWILDRERLEPFLNTYGCFSYTYSERMFGLHNLIGYLKKNPGGRRAFLSIWFEETDAHNRTVGDPWLPCSIGYHFMKRNGKLHMVYLMRSCNIDWLPTDIWLATGILEHVAEKIKAKVGDLQVFINSLHRYEGGKK